MKSCCILLRCSWRICSCTSQENAGTGAAGWLSVPYTCANDASSGCQGNLGDPSWERARVRVSHHSPPLLCLQQQRGGHL